jgi:FtsZ-interacting cell division protein ZipA
MKVAIAIVAVVSVGVGAFLWHKRKQSMPTKAQPKKKPASRRQRPSKENLTNITDGVSNIRFPQEVRRANA